MTGAASLALFVPGAIQAQISTADLEAFRPRSIGPAVTGGRVHDVEALPLDPSTLFVATASGGLWKTTNRGITWRNVFEFMPVSTFGDVAISESDPHILYAGTGEQNNRQSTSWGNGVYRSDDSGETWRHLGLVETRHIGKVEVHPSNPDIVYVAALGNLWAPSEERGVFRSTNGGRGWEKVLYIDEYTGVVDMVMDPSNPNVLYAATYQRLRRTWGFNGGGPGSGIYKTTDGGDTWTELSNGIPGEDKGRIGLAISRSNPQILNALIEYGRPPGQGGGGGGGGFGGGRRPANPNQGTYRTEDGGRTWSKVSDQNQRPMYYSEIFIDPTNPNRVYALSTTSMKSEDGGRTWDRINAQPTYDVGVHSDMHAMWIDPGDPEHFYLAGDAGLHETYDLGQSYRKINNFNIAQFYAIGVDMRDPYWVYGGLQDNHSFMGPSETRHWEGIVNDDWRQSGFGDGMYQQVDPENHRYLYTSSNGGSYTRLDTETGDALSISPQPPPGVDYRFDWTSPSLVSRHDSRVVYVAGNRLFISRNRGESWERTEDLSKQADRDELELMGVKGGAITISRNDGTSSYGEAVTLAESPLNPAILWVGMDDGNIQVSRDQGQTWTEVSENLPSDLRGTYPSRVLGSLRGEGAAYLTLDAHRDGDFDPYVFRTADFGESWENITNNLPTGSANVIIEQPDNPNVLFLGTEHALFVSFDAGGRWVKMPHFPTTHYDDLVIHPREKDLVAGTHGRSIYILEDTRPLAELPNAMADAQLFSIPRGTLKNYWKDTSYRGQAEYAGENPPDGVYIAYRLGAGGGAATLRITNAFGQEVQQMQVPSDAGVHRITWDLQWDFSGETETWRPLDTSEVPRTLETRAASVSPGTYTATLEARGTTSTQMMEVRGDPELPVADSQYRARERYMIALNEIEELLEGGGIPDEMAQNIRRQMRALSVTGRGFRGGSYFGPTVAQREALAEIQRELAELQENQR
jgi:photosystem II stability/assembly factor-like uncharacterized protein